MKSIKNSFWSALITGAFFLPALQTQAQKSFLELLPGAEKLSYNEKTGAQRITGNLSFKYQGNVMFCDSADYYERSNEVRAYGHVQINKNDTLNLYCDSLYYNGKTKKARLWGHVRVRDREYKLTTDSLEYDAGAGVAIYRRNGRVESMLSNEVLTSRVGYLYPNSKNLFFSGKVRYKSDKIEMETDTLRFQYLQKKAYFYGPTQIRSEGKRLFCSRGWYQVETEEGVLQQHARIEDGSRFISGDSLYYHPKKGLSIGKGHVSYRDTAEPVSFTGHYFVKNDRLHRAYLTGNAIAAYRLKEDTLLIHGDTLFSFMDSTDKARELRAYRNVRMYKPDFQGVCDSLTYPTDSSRIYFYGQPKVWSSNMELKGNSMQVHIRDSVLERIDIIDQATAIALVDTAGYYNQVGGRLMQAYFKNDELIRAEVKGNAQTVYYPEETTKNDTLVEIKRKGMSRVYAADLKVYLDSGEVQGVVYIEKPDAVMYPMSGINKEEQYIMNFGWNPALRPRSPEDLLHHHN